MIPKFRAWDKYRNEMYKVRSISFETEEIETDNEQITFETVIIMQSTGLHDKNGVEIYEGDIVRWFSPILEKIVWTGTVIRDGAEMCIQTSKRSRTSGGLLNVLARDEAIKVIGNIYKNPRLLEEAE